MFNAIMGGLKTIGLSVLGEFAGGIIGGAGAKGGAAGSSAATTAALQKIGFVEEKKAAIRMAENAARRGESRYRDPREGQKQPSQYAREVANMYQQAFKGSVRAALIEQLNRQGYSTHSAAVAAAYSGDDATSPTIKPRTIAI
jgi:hypothetical protein